MPAVLLLGGRMLSPRLQNVRPERLFQCQETRHRPQTSAVASLRAIEANQRDMFLSATSSRSPGRTVTVIGLVRSPAETVASIAACTGGVKRALTS